MNGHFLKKKIKTKEIQEPKTDEKNLLKKKWITPKKTKNQNRWKIIIKIKKRIALQMKTYRKNNVVREKNERGKTKNTL